jgi:hypothetical protein
MATNVSLDPDLMSRPRKEIIDRFTALPLLTPVQTGSLAQRLLSQPSARVTAPLHERVSGSLPVSRG